MKNCTICGKDFDLFDTQLDFSFQKQVGYGSVHDGEYIRLNLCCDCFDRVITMIEPLSKKKLFSEETEDIK